MLINNPASRVHGGPSAQEGRASSLVISLLPVLVPLFSGEGWCRPEPPRHRHPPCLFPLDPNTLSSRGSSNACTSSS